MLQFEGFSLLFCVSYFLLSWCKIIAFRWLTDISVHSWVNFTICNYKCQVHILIKSLSTPYSFVSSAFLYSYLYVKGVYGQGFVISKQPQRAMEIVIKNKKQINHRNLYWKCQECGMKRGCGLYK